MNTLEFKNVNKHYGKKYALKNFDYKFQPGVYGLLGPNGAGKSTLMNLITDNLNPDDDNGSILWNGSDIRKLGRSYRKNLGYMPQQQEIYPTVTAERFLGYIASLKGVPRKSAMTEIKDLLHKVELSDCADKKIGGFSGGMKQRVLIASALLGDPQLIIMDEPTAGLDPRQRVIVRNLISDLGKDKIILIATHITSDIEDIADKVIILKKGEIIADGKVPELIKNVETSPQNLENLYLQYFEEKGDEKENANLSL